MSFFDALNQLFTANKQASPPPAATPAASAPVTPSYTDYFKALQSSAAADEKAHPTSLWSWLSGSGHDAAVAKASVAAPGAYFDLLAKQAGAEGGQLNLAQALTFMNRYRAANGQPPVDANNVLGSVEQGSPGAAPVTSAPAQTAAASDQPPTVSTLPKAAPVDVAPTPPPWSPTTNAATAAPLQGTLTAPPNPFIPSIPGAPKPLDPSATPQAPNPLQQQRAFFTQMAQAMGGLPSMANTMTDYFKLANQGLTPELGAVTLPDGNVADAISGQPIAGDVNSRYSTRAGQVATAQAIPHVAAEQTIDNNRHQNTLGEQTNQANLERGTNAARVAAESAYKAPVLMRAPDGSIVGVTPTQMAQANGTGALAGYRPLTEEDTKTLGAFGTQYAQDQATLPDVRNTQNTIRVMLDQAKSFPPGTFGDVRAGAGRILTGLGADPDQVAKVVGNPAGADVILKNTLTLAMQRLKQNFGQSREAGFIVEKTMQANPNIATQPEAYSFMLNTMNQEAQRQADYLTAQQQYRAQHGTLDGFAPEFDRTHPVTAYANQALVDTYGAPAGSVFLGRSQGKPVFQSPNGKKFMVTH